MPTTSYQFTRREREVLEMICLGSPPKQIAAELEISVSAVNANIARACEKAGVVRSEIVIFLLQHPGAARKGGTFTRGLHPIGCPCDSPYCRGMRRAA